MMSLRRRLRSHLHSPPFTATAAPAQQASTLVWDAPTRAFHWLFVLSFVVAWLTAEADGWRLVHVTAGYTVGALLVFRIVWGLVGTRHARFSDFVRGPGAVAAYFRSLARRQPEHHTGHNPAGALAVLAMLGLAALTVVSGWAVLVQRGGELMEDVHESVAGILLTLVLLHIVAVLVSSRLHHEHLVGAMVHGRKPVPAAEGIRRAWRGVTVAMLLALLAYWWLQWRAAPTDLVTGVVVGERADQGED